jgi:copper resistance protein D
MVLVRAVHFAATISTSGVVFFAAFIAEPVFRRAGHHVPMAAALRSRLAWTAWISLALTIASGAAWLVLQAELLSELPLRAAFAQGAVWSVLSDTDFGHAWIARLGFAIGLAGLLFITDSKSRRLSSWRAIVAVLLAAGLIGSLAFAGHAAAGTGLEGMVHMGSDILHLIAAAAWVGALVPLALLLGYAACDGPSIAVARAATVRFSTLGIVSVGILVVTGIVNGWILSGSVAALLGTDYGRLLGVKVAVFAIMVMVAGINRLWLTPRLVGASRADVAVVALRRLRRNSLIEATLGAVIVVIVGVLGMLPPGIDA